MAVRSTMAALISAVRLLINDPSNPAATPPVVPRYDDQTVQDALDHQRVDVNYLELATKPSIAPGGAVLWLDYYALAGTRKIGDWEQDVILQGYPNFAVLAPITSDYITGHWTFDTSLYTWGQRPPVYLVGKTYDRFAAAVELLEDWATALKLNYAFSANDHKFALSEQVKNILLVVGEYKRRCRPHTLQMQRSDTPQTLWQRGQHDISRTSF